MTDPKTARYIVMTTETPPDTKPEYFVFDTGNNEYYKFASEEEALRMAWEILDDMRYAREDTWPPETEDIRVGVITHRAVITREWEEDGNEYCDFGIQKIAESQP